MVKVFYNLLISCVLCVLLSSCFRAGDDEPVGVNPVHEGWVLFRQAEYGRAIKTFERAESEAGENTDQRLMAYYGQATVWNLRLPVPKQDKPRAAKLYQLVLAADSEHDLAAWSRLALARIKHLVASHETPDYNMVRAAYQEVIDHHPTHAAAHEAIIFQQATLVATLNPEDAKEALEILETFAKNNPTSGYASAAYSLMMVAYGSVGEPQKKLEAEIQSLEHVEVDPQAKQQDQSWRYWSIATIAEFEAGDFAAARKYYRKLIDAFPTDARMYAAEQALIRMDETENALRGAP